MLLPTQVTQDAAGSTCAAGSILLCAGMSSLSRGGSIKLSAASSSTDECSSAKMTTPDGTGVGGSGAVVLQSGTALFGDSGGIKVSTGSSTTCAGTATIACGDSSESKGAPMTAVAGATASTILSGGDLNLMSGSALRATTGAMKLASKESCEATGFVNIASGDTEGSSSAGSILIKTEDALGGAGSVSYAVGSSSADEGSSATVSVAEAKLANAVGGEILISTAACGSTGGDTLIIGGAGTAVTGSTCALAAACAPAVAATGTASETGAATIVTGMSTDGVAAC